MSWKNSKHVWFVPCFHPAIIQNPEYCAPFSTLKNTRCQEVFGICLLYPIYFKHCSGHDQGGSGNLIKSKRQYFVNFSQVGSIFFYIGKRYCILLTALALFHKEQSLFGDNKSHNDLYAIFKCYHCKTYISTYKRYPNTSEL